MKKTEDTKTNNQLIPVSQIAKARGYSPGHLKLQIREGKLRAEKKNGVWHTTNDWVDQYSAKAEAKKKEHRKELSKSLSWSDHRESAQGIFLEHSEKPADAAVATEEPGTQRGKNSLRGKAKIFKFALAGIIVAAIAVTSLWFGLPQIGKFEKQTKLSLSGDSAQKQIIADNQMNSDGGLVAGTETSSTKTKGLVLAATDTANPKANVGDIEVSAFLMNLDNQELQSGEYDVRFSLYSVDRTETDPYPSDTDKGSRVWQESRKVTIQNGFFSAYLGESAPLPANLDFGSKIYFVGIRIGQDSEMIPRKRIGAVPLARVALSANSLSGQNVGNANGNIPLSNGTLNTGLNADTLDGQQAAAFQPAGNYLTSAPAGYSPWKLQTSAGDAGQKIKSGKGAIFTGANGVLTSRNLNTLTISLDPTAYATLGGITVKGETVTDFTGSGLSVVNGALTATGTNTTYTAAPNNLLQLSGTTFSVKQGLMTDGKFCTYDGIDGELVCNVDAGAMGVSYWTQYGTDVANNNSGNVGIGTSSPGQKLSIAGTLGILEGGASPQFYTTFQGGDQSGNQTYTLPTGYPAGNGYLLSSTLGGTLSWSPPGAASIALGGTISGGGLPGSVLFIDNQNKLAQDNANFFWNVTDHRLGIGTTNPTYKLEVNGSFMANTTAPVFGAYTLTMTGNATLSGLNTGDQTLVGLGGVPTTRNLTINGTAYDLTADRTWNVGTVTAVSVATANGFAGTSSGGTAPQLTLTTSVTGLVKGNGTALSAATAGTDYIAGNVGAQYYVPYFSAMGTLANSNIYYNGSNVGIGTTNPLQKLSVAGTLGIAGSNPQYYTVFQGGNQSLDLTYTLPTAGPTLAGQVLKINGSNEMYWATVSGGSGGIGTVTSVASGNGLTGGPITDSGTLSIALLGAGTTTPTTNSFSGLEFVNSQLSLLHGCSNNQVLAWNSAAGQWTCANVAGGGGAGGVGGNGIANYLSRWSDANTLTSSILYETGGNIGIGTTMPGAKLQVAGNVSPDGGNAYDLGDSTNSWRNLYIKQIYLNGGDISKNGSTLFMGTSDTNSVSIMTNNTTRMFLDGAFNYLGINTTQPRRRLDILDTSNPQLRLTYTDNSVYTDLRTTSAGNLSINPSGGLVGIGTSSPGYALDVAGSVNASTSLCINNDCKTSWGAGGIGQSYSAANGLTLNGSAFELGGTLSKTTAINLGGFNFGFQGTGNVGIGTTNPGQALDVIGSIRTNNQFISTVSTGTAPLTVSSTTLVSNLNSDYLDGQHGAYYAAASSAVNTVSIASANGFAGTSSGGTAPQLTLTTSVNGLVKGNGTALSAASAGTDYIAGNVGAANQVAYFSGQGALTGTNSLWFNGTNLGIGTSAPTDKLDISGGMKIGTTYAGMSTTAPTNGLLVQGNVGIGTTAPAGALHVAGSTMIFGAGEGGTPTATTIRGAAGSGTNIAGADLTFDASNGTGLGGSGNLIFRTAGPSGGAITRDSSSHATTGSNVTTISWSHTVSNAYSNRVLIVAASFSSCTTRSVSSVTFDSVAMTALDNTTCDTGTGMQTSLYYLNESQLSGHTGSAKTVTANFSGTGVYPDAEAVDYGNVNQSTPFGTVTKSSFPFSGSTSGTITLSSIPSQTNDVTVDFPQSNYNWGTATVTGSGQSSIYAESGANPSVGMSQSVGGSSSTTMSWSLSIAVHQWQDIGFALKAIQGSSSDQMAERMRITNSGNVGIGTTTALATLSINPTIASTSDYYGVKNGLVYNGGTAMANYWGEYISAPTGSGAITNKYAFVTEANAGNVGIGTTAPTDKLDVNGGMKIGTTYAGMGTTAPTNGMLVQGYVGIGTTNPGQKLDVVGGSIRTDNQFISTVSTGTAPLTVSSTTLVSNLNSDLLDGQHGAYYATASSAVNTISIASSNGFAGTSSGGTAPQLTISTSVNGMAKGNGTALSAATAGTDYIAGNVGANHQIAYFNGLGALTGSNTMWFDGTNVGIGTSAPAGLFDVNSKFTVLTGGNVGVGTTNPVGLLDVGAGKLTVLSGGNVGVGTTSPSHVFDTRGSVSDYIGYFYNSSTNVAAGGLYIRSDGIGSLLTLNYNGTNIVDITQAQSTFNNPVNFASAGDVSMAHNLYMTNTTAAYMKFQGPGYIQTDSPSQNLDLTLSAANGGYVVVADTLQIAMSSTSTTAATEYGTYATISDTGVVTSGTDTTYGNYLSVTRTGATGGVVNVYGQYINLAADNAGSGTSTAYGLYVDATGSTADSTYSAIFNGGNVGIGTITPGYKLEVAGGYSVLGEYNTQTRPASNGGGGMAVSWNYNVGQAETDLWNLYDGAGSAGTAFQFHQKTGASTHNTIMTLLGNGNVGIGTTNPLEKLHVIGYAKSSSGFVTGDATANSSGGLVNADDTSKSIRIGADLGAAGANSYISFTVDGSSEVARMITGGNVGIGTTAPLMPLTVSRDGILDGTWSSEGNFYAVSRFSNSASTYGVDIGYGGTSGNGLIAPYASDKDLVLATYSSSGYYVEGLRIKNGNVGIGTTNPGNKLVVQTATANDGILLNNTSSGNSLLTFSRSGVTKAYTGIDSGNGAIAGAGADDFDVRADNNLLFAAGGATERMRIASGGNVGIGTTNPLTKLEVYGNISVTNELIFYPGQNSDVAGYINYSGYQGGLTQYRDLSIGDGRGTRIMYVDGSAGTVSVRATAENGVSFLIDGTNTGNTTYGLIVRDSSNATNNLYIRDDGAGYLRAAAWSYGSDRRMKENISYIGSGLDKIMALKPASFDYINGAKNNLGFIAQDVQQVIPEAVGIGDPKTGMLALKTDFIVPYLVAGMQQQQALITQNAERTAQVDLKIDNNISSVNDLQTAVNDKLNIVSNSLNSLNSSVTSYGLRVTEAERKLQTQENNLANFEQTTNDTLTAMLETENMLTEKVLSHEDRLKALEDKLATMTVTGGSIPSNVVTQDSSGNVTLAGVFKAKTVQADGVVAGEADMKSMKVGPENSGKDQIGAGTTAVTIPAASVQPDSKIYITPIGSTSGQVLYVDNIKEGESFDVKIDQAVEQKDILFNWLIVK